MGEAASELGVSVFLGPIYQLDMLHNQFQNLVIIILMCHFHL